MAALIKFGNSEHLGVMRNEGLLYMNPLPFFWKCDGTDALRGDHFDSVEEIVRGTKFAIGKSPDEMGPIMTGNFHFRIHPPDSHTINLFCMFAFVPNRTPLPIDERVFEFGTHALVINDVDEFVRRLMIVIERDGIQFERGLVEYVDDDHCGEVGPLRKLKKFEFQSEWRLVCYDGPGDVRQIRIGSISDISVLVSCEDLRGKTRGSQTTIDESDPAIQETYRMFDEIIAGIPMTYKRPPFVQVSSLPSGWSARWFDQRIEYLPGVDGGTMSHELGHMFHSAICDFCGPLQPPFHCEHDGEAVAEAVRYFVAERMGGRWDVSCNRQVLESCNSKFEDFKNLIRGLIHSKLGE